MSVNKFIGLGRLANELELKYLPSGQAVCNFSMAMNEKYKNKQGEQEEKVEYIRVRVWGKLAELCSQYLSKGRQAYIEGSLQTRSYDDKDGNKKYISEIIATTVQFIGGSSSDNNDSQENNNFQGEDIPF